MGKIAIIIIVVISLSICISGFLSNWTFEFCKDNYIETPENIKDKILEKTKKKNNNNKNTFQTIIENDDGTYSIIDIIKNL